MTVCPCLLIMIKTFKSCDLARRLDLSALNSEIPLIHLAILQQTAFSIGLKISMDSKISQLLLRIKRGEAGERLS